MIIDFRAGTGNVPRSGRCWTMADLRHWADLAGIDLTLVESMDARLHADEGPHEQLLAACRASQGRFLPLMTIRLESDRVSIQRASSARARGFAGVVLHGTLWEESLTVHAVLEALGQAPLPVYRELAYEEMDRAFRIASSHPRIAFVFAPSGFQGFELNHRLCTLPNVYLAMAHTLVSVGQLETACRLMGADHILFAGDQPQQHPARPVGLVHDADITADQRALVLGGSASRLLAAHGINVPAPATAAKPRPPLPCPIFDTHGHIGSDYRRPDFDSSVDAVLRYLERAGGDVICVSSTEAVFGDVIDGNRCVENAMRAHPDRIRGYLVINPWMREACLNDIRGARARGFSGLKPYPSTFGHQLSDDIMDPIWDLAAELDLPILCHSRAEDLARVLARRPHTKMLAAHMSFEYAQKARLARDYHGVVLEISGAGAGPQDILDALEIAGPDKLVFGSDLNNHVLGYTLQPLLCSGLEPGILKAVLRENALRFFGLR